MSTAKNSVAEEAKKKLEAEGKARQAAKEILGIIDRLTTEKILKTRESRYQTHKFERPTTSEQKFPEGISTTSIDILENRRLGGPEAFNCLKHIAYGMPFSAQDLQALQEIGTRIHLLRDFYNTYQPQLQEMLNNYKQAAKLG